MINIRKLEAGLWESADLLRAGSKLTSNQCSPTPEYMPLSFPYRCVLTSYEPTYRPHLLLLDIAAFLIYLRGCTLKSLEGLRGSYQCAKIF